MASRKVSNTPGYNFCENLFVWGEVFITIAQKIWLEVFLKSLSFFFYESSVSKAGWSLLQTLLYYIKKEGFYFIFYYGKLLKKSKE